VSPSPTTPEEASDPGKLIQQYINKKYGRRVLIVGFVLYLLWSNWNWSTVKDLPGVSTVVKWWSQAPLPKADPRRFAIALAHLEKDKEQQHELLIREVLKDFEGVQLLQFDRTISLEGTQPEDKEEKGHAQARQYLKDSEAHVLIWGVILRHDDKSAPRLYWTTPQDSKRATAPYQPENFKLPELFWNDLAEVLRLVVATQYSKFRAQEEEGRFIADQLAPFIERVRKLLDKSTGRPGWSEVQVVLGDALSALGEQTGKNKPLEEAVAAYRAALTEWTREQVPLGWARAQHGLGTTLTLLGERDKGTTHLKEAVEAYEEALKEWTRKRAPLDWAKAQMNLGTALMILGEREGGTARLGKVVEAYQEVLKEWTRKQVPLRWAATQFNLGNALTILGEREGGTARLGRAVEAYEEALKEWTRKRAPLGWVATQHGLGNTLRILGEREGGTTHLEKAATACRVALQELTREQVPLDWAKVQINLGATLKILGERKKDATLLCAALEKQLMAWEVSIMDSPSTATIAENHAKSTVITLKKAFNHSMYETCVAKHVETLKRIGSL